MKNLIFCLLFCSSVEKIFGAEQLFHQHAGERARESFPSTPIEIAQKEKDQAVLVRIKMLLLSSVVDKKAQLENICFQEMDLLSIDGQLGMAELVISETPSTARHMFWRVACNLDADVEQVIRAANGLSVLGNKECALPLYTWLLTQSTVTFRILYDISQSLKTHAPNISTIACCQAALWLPLQNKNPIIAYLVKNNFQALMPSTSEQMSSEIKKDDLLMIAESLRVVDEKLRIEILKLAAKAGL